MESCKHFKEQISFYLDGELGADERQDLEAHIANCPACRVALRRERDLLESIRDARLIYQVPPGLLARLEPILRDASLARLATSKFNSDAQSIGREGADLVIPVSSSRRYRWMALAATIVVVSMMAALFLTKHGEVVSSDRVSDFALMAVDTHLRHLRGQLPLEVVSGSAELISAWFVGKVPFGLTLPNYQESSGQEKTYQLEGARLVGFKSDYAGYVAYRMRQRPITLVVTSNAVALPSGGEQVVSRGITFHYDSIDGLKVITWSDRGLTYALVSDLEERGQQSCLVCHSGTRDQDFVGKMISR